MYGCGWSPWIFPSQSGSMPICTIMMLMMIGSYIDSKNPYLSTYSHYPITKKMDFVNQIMDDKPLLIVGIKKARELYSDKIDLDNNFIEKNIYWCYSPEEYLSEFLKKYEEKMDQLNIKQIFISNRSKQYE